MKTLETLENYASEHDVPIMSKESIDFVSKTLTENKAVSILEIGTAIAYSASALASQEPKRFIDTIERDQERFNLAIKNIKDLNLEDQIKAHCVDAHHYRVDRYYDGLIIDAAKAQNLSFFKLFFAYTDKVCIIDNIDYHGFVEDNFDLIRSRNLRSMMRRIQEFKAYLESRDDLEVNYHNVGDGMIVVRRKAFIE